MSEHTFIELMEFLDKCQFNPEWNEYFVMMCKMVSKRSSCDRLHVGCVLVKDNVVVSTGYNGFIAGAPHVGVVRKGDDGKEHEQMTIHAEMNAIANASKRGVSTLDTKCYVTHFPCINCAKLLLSAGINEIIYIEDYHNDELVKELCLKKGCRIYKCM
jgi:dCMP deaminase